MNEFAQGPVESPRAWLSRLQAIKVEVLSTAQRRVRISYLAEARRLLQEEHQQAKWNRDQK